MTGKESTVERPVNGSEPKMAWYALYTRPRHEKTVRDQLTEKRIETYLPLRRVLRLWSDRKKWVEEPLFRSYLFVHTHEEARLMALRTPGAIRVVSFQGRPAKVRDEEIENIRWILKEIPDVETGDPVRLGDRVEVIRGPLSGLQGRLIQVHGSHRLVVLIESIRQALHINVGREDIRVIH